MNDVLERVSAARTYLTAKVPFLGFLTLKLRPRVATEYDVVPTAAVGPDGTLVLNEEFVAGLSDPELRGVLAHEVLHPALRFFERLGSKDLRAFNCSHDFTINLIIQDFISGGLSGSILLPPGGLLDRKYSGMSAEEIYESFPEVSMERLIDMMEEQSGQGDEDGKDGKEGKDGKDGKEGKKGIGLDCRKDISSTKAGSDAGKGDESAQGKLEKEWQVAVVAAAQVHEQQKGRGSLPGKLRLMIDEMLDPKHHWTDIISQWLGENAGNPDLTYQRPSRRSESVGEVLIGRRRKSYPDVTILWDTSGSMAGEEKKIFPEVATICEELDLTLRVIIIDAAIHADLEDVKEAEEIAEAIAGGGGSDFNPAFQRLEEEHNDSVVVAFTDGYIGVPETQPESLKGVVWVITHGGVDPTRGRWGQVLKLNPDETGEWA